MPGWLIAAGIILVLAIAVGVGVVVARHSNAESPSDESQGTVEIVPQSDWDFYPCRVDGSSATIQLDLSLMAQVDDASEDTLYRVVISMHDPDAHGMGSVAEARTLQPIQDRIVQRAEPMGLRFIARLRHEGSWQATFMGPSGQEPAINDIVEEEVATTSHRFELFSAEDADWSYYAEFLFPDERSLQWISDRRVIDTLRKSGDPLTKPRRVEHWAFFAGSDQGERFANAARELGFEASVSADDARENPYIVRAARVDSVELESIHAVVLELIELAREHGGSYDGWETPVQAPGGP